MYGMTDGLFWGILRCNNKSLIIGDLNLSQFNDLSKNIIFAHGEGAFPEIQNNKLRWIAIKNDKKSWSILYSDWVYTWDGILHHGEILGKIGNIKLLVPSNSEMLIKYKFFR